MNRSPFILAIMAVLIFFSPGAALGCDSFEEITLFPSADTFVSSQDHGDRRNMNFGSAEKLKVVRGKKDKSGHYRGWKGSLIRFDLSGIPSGAEVLEGNGYPSIGSRKTGLSRERRGMRLVWVVSPGGRVGRMGIMGKKPRIRRG